MSSTDPIAPEPLLPSVLPKNIEELEALQQAWQQAWRAEWQSVFDAQVEAIKEECRKEAEKEYQRKLHEAILEYIEQARLARHRQFGPSSESSAQGRLFNEAEDSASFTPEAEATVTIPEALPVASVKRGKRGPLPAELKRIDIIHDLPEEEKRCACGTPMIEIGEEISEQLDIVPMQIRVLRHIRKRYGCPDKQHKPVIAALPPQPLPKSNASADFIAMLLTVKFVDGMPLARFEYVLDRHHAPVPRNTLARLVINSSRLLQPLHNLLRDHLLSHSVIHMDETSVQVLKEPGKSPTGNKYMWVQTAGPPDRPVILYDYDPSRSQEVPLRLLETYQGYLMTDGYDGYNAVAKREGIEHLSCWAHARRYFVEAARVQTKCMQGKADEAIRFIAKLYQVEKEHRTSTTEIRHQARQQSSLPILNELRHWLEKTLPTIPPKSKLGEALAYLKRYWPRLIRYTERGDLPIDNNRCENAIRPFVIGRKAWLFSDTPAGAHASAVIYSLVQTAKANHVEPYLWLRYVLRELPKAQSVEDMEKLLPWNVNVEILADLLKEL